MCINLSFLYIITIALFFMVKFSKSGNLEKLDRAGYEIEALITAFPDMAKDIDEKHYATPECTSSAKHILRTTLDN